MSPPASSTGPVRVASWSPCLLSGPELVALHPPAPPPQRAPRGPAVSPGPTTPSFLGRGACGPGRSGEGVEGTPPWSSGAPSRRVGAGRTGKPLTTADGVAWERPPLCVPGPHQTGLMVPPAWWTFVPSLLTEPRACCPVGVEGALQPISWGQSSAHAALPLCIVSLLCLHHGASAPSPEPEIRQPQHHLQGLVTVA